LPVTSLESAVESRVPTATQTPSAAQTNTPLVSQVQIATIDPAAIRSDVDCTAEIEAYQDLAAAGVEVSPFQVPIIAGCLVDANETTDAIAIYQQALEADLDRLAEVTIRQDLADLLVEQGDHQAAVAQYDAILTVAETEASRSRALFQAGQAELSAGNQEAGYARLMALVNEYPEAAQSHAALTELLRAGYTVGDTLQGLIAFNAGAYDVASAAFVRAVEGNSVLTLQTHLHLAWSLERLGDVDGALARLDAFIGARESPPDGGASDLTEAAAARIERAKMNERAARTQAALDDYQTYIDLYPQGVDAPSAAWKLASLAQSLGANALARDRFLVFAQNHPRHGDAAEATFRAGFLSWELGEKASAQNIWRQAAETYPQRDYGAAALLWLLRTLPAAERAQYEGIALNGNGLGYYGPRADHFARGVQPFVSNGTANLNAGDTGRDFAESWLRRWLELAPDTPVGELSADLAADPRLAWAEKLWSSGARFEAARQFELLQAAHSGDALASYQLALYFRDLGLYKSSVLAALSLMNLAGVGAADAPRFIARLAYPAYFADLIQTEAQRYGYDPLLQLALIREESYFDALATSPLGARGLSQILPGTGSTVARELGWPGYQAGTLYRPDAAITFGAYYLDQLLQRYDGNVAAALAAYNAGPGFADGWLQLEADDFDRFLETIDFPETQRFIKQIYITHAIYRFLYT
jgi:soluble lytic murein transglycosylase